MTGHQKLLASLTAVFFLLAGAMTAMAIELPYSGTDLTLWLKADGTLDLDPGVNLNRVIGWSDEIGVGGNAVAQDGVGPGGVRPLWRDNRINGRPAVFFDNTSRTIIGDAVLAGGNGARTIFVVGTATNGSNNQILFDPNGQGSGATLFRMTPEMAVRFGNGNNRFQGDPLGTTPAIVAAQLPAGGTIGSTVMFKNSATPLPSTGSDNPGNAVNTGTSGYRMGTANYQGEIAEVLVFDAALSTAELNKVGSYLAGKYGIAAGFTGDEIYWDNGSTDVTSPVSPPYPGDNLWSTASNWRADNGPQGTFPNDTLPGPTDRVNISLHDVPAQTPAPANVEAGDDILVNSVRVGGNFGLGVGGAGVLNINGGTLTIADNGGVGTGGRLELGGTGNRDGVLNVNGGTLNVGLDISTGASGTGESTINLEGGTLATPSTDITVDNFNINSLDGGGAVTYTRNGGTLAVNNNLQLGGESSGDGNHKGNLTQSSGAVTVGGDLLFGGAAAGNNEGGTYNLDGGTLNVTGNIIEGASGSPNASIDAAQLHIDGGTLTVGGDITVQRFAVGQDNGTTGSYSIAAGQSVESTGTTAVGSNGTGTLDVTAAGASLKSTNAVIGEGGNGDGTVNITNGSTWEVAQFVRIGHNGTGEVNLENGTLDVTGISGNPRGLRLAENGSGDGALIIGTAAGSGTGGATVNVSGGNTETANAGVGEITMHHGTFNQLTSNLIISQAAGSDATFTLHDGLVDVQNQLRFNAGTGLFEQHGGTVNVGTILDIANNPTSDGTYRMLGGTLNAGDRVNSDLLIGNHNTAAASALMEVIDGTVNVSKSIRIADNGVNSSGTLIVGDGATSPTVNLNTAAGGNFETADNGTGTFTLQSGAVNMQDSNFITGQSVNSEATVAVGGFATAATLNLEGGDNNRDWNTNGGHGIVSVLENGTINVARNMNLGNNVDANSGLELTIDGGTVNVGTKKAAGGTIDYRNNGPMDNIALLDGTLNLNGGTINLRSGPTTLFDFEGGTLLDVGLFDGTLTQNGGTLAAGSSPGTMDIDGNYLFNLGTLEVEINAPFVQGEDPGYDFYDVTDDAELGNTLAASDGPAVLEVKLLPGYTWAQGDYFDVLEAASITENDDFVFDGAANGGLWTYEIIPGAGSDPDILRITADVPEPATLLVWSLLAALCLGMGWRRRRR